MKQQRQQHLGELYGLIASIQNRREAKQVLQDLLTPSERDTVAERWQIVKRLAKGIPQREISHTLKVSIAKVTRGSHAFRRGAGGFRILLERS